MKGSEVPNPPNDANLQGLKDEVQKLKDQIIEQEHRALKVAHNLIKPETWSRTETRNAALLSAAHLAYTFARAGVVVGTAGGLIAIAVALFQILEMRTQTTAMIDQATQDRTEARNQTTKMQESNQLTKELHAQQRQTDLLQLFYAAETKPPVRTMALRELLQERHSDLVLTNADLTSVRLPMANFDALDMHNATLEGASLKHSTFNATNLQGALLDNLNVGTLNEGRPTILQQATLTLARGKSVDFSAASLAGSNVQEHRSQAPTLSTQPASRL